MRWLEGLARGALACARRTCSFDGIKERCDPLLSRKMRQNRLEQLSSRLRETLLSSVVAAKVLKPREFVLLVDVRDKHRAALPALLGAE